MLKEILSGTASTLKPKNKTAFLWFLAVPLLAVTAFFSKHTHVRNADGKENHMYIFGKKGNPKMVFVTNQNPKMTLKKAAKNYLNSNFKT